MFLSKIYFLFLGRLREKIFCKYFIFVSIYSFDILIKVTPLYLEIFVNLTPHVSVVHKYIHVGIVHSVWSFDVSIYDQKETYKFCQIKGLNKTFSNEILEMEMSFVVICILIWKRYNFCLSTIIFYLFKWIFSEKESYYFCA